MNTERALAARPNPHLCPHSRMSQNNPVRWIWTFAALIFAIVGCSDAIGPTGGVVSVGFDPPAPTSLEVGTSVQLSPIPLDENGERLELVCLETYSSSDPSVALVTSTGVLTAVSEGDVVITVALNGVATEFTVTVVEDSGGTHPGPHLVLTAEALTFTATEGGADPDPQTVQVTSSGGTVDGLAVSISYGPGGSDWLTATPGSGSTPADLELTATIGGLAPGTYTATVTVTGDDAEPTAMQVTLDLQPDGGTDPTDPDPDPQLILITEDVTFTATEGGADPDPRPVQVASSGEPVSGLSASISYGPGASDWLTVMLGGDTTPTDLELAAAIAGLAPGTYTATVTVTGTDALPAELQVTLDLQAGGGSGPGGPDPDTQLELSADDVSFTATEGSADPDPQTAIVTSSGDPVDALAVAITYGPGGVGWLNATLASTTTPADLELAAAIAGLAPGTYTATVTVTGTDALPAELQVTLDLQADGGAPGDPDADLIGLRLEIGADALAGGGLLELDLAQLLSDPILGFTVWALYSDSTKQDVTTLATATTSDPLLTLDGPGVLNLAGVLVNALIDPDHYLHVEY